MKTSTEAAATHDASPRGFWQGAIWISERGASLDAEMQEKWRAFERHALALLKSAPNEMPWTERGVRRALRVVITPAFEAARLYELLERTRASTDEERWLMARRRWDRPADAEGFASPVAWLQRRGQQAPTIQGATAGISSADASEIRQRLRAVSVPLFPLRSSFGVDCTSYELSWGDHWAGGQLHWLEQGPSEWSALTTEVQHFIKAAEALPNWSPLGRGDDDT